MNRRYRESLIEQYCSDKSTDPLVPLAIVGAGLFVAFLIAALWLIFPSNTIG